MFESSSFQDRALFIQNESRSNKLLYVIPSLVALTIFGTNIFESQQERLAEFKNSSRYREFGPAAKVRLPLIIFGEDVVVTVPGRTGTLRYICPLGTMSNRPKCTPVN